MEQVLKVLRIDAISETVSVFCLGSDSELVDFEPGSFIEIQTPYGWRSYSLIDEACRNNTYRIAVKRDNQGKKGSLWMHQNLAVGTTLVSRKPKNNFKFKPNLNKNIFIAGGIGVTPLVSILKDALKTGAEQIFYFSYGSQADENIFSQLVGKDKHEQLELNLYPTEYKKRHININDLVEKYGVEANYFCCGPAGMIESFKEVMSAKGISNYFFEYFSAERKQLFLSGVNAELEHAIYLEKSQKTVMMSPNEYILEALKRAGVDVAYSCESGICGTCEARILKGRVEHNDHILSSSEKQRGEAVMLCTARPLSAELVLDL